ncbi:MAG: hypothetical protein AAF413_00370 [Patescibacteria group bacterium]
MKQPDSLTRKYILAAIVIAVAVWDIAFNFGAFKTIFFDKFFLVWIISIAIILADIALENKRILKGWSLVAMLSPTVALGLTVWSYYLGDTESLFSFVLFLFSTVLTVLFLPYAAYIILSVTQSDMLKINSKRLSWWLVGIAVIIGLLGFVIGHYNRYFLTCESFKVSGNDLPDNCFEEERKLRDRL